MYRFLYMLQKHEIHIKTDFLAMCKGRRRRHLATHRIIRLSVRCDSGRCFGYMDEALSNAIH